VEPVVTTGYRAAASALRRRLDGDIVYAVKPRPMSFGVGVLATLRRGRGLIVDVDDWEVALSSRRRVAGSPIIAAARGGYRRVRRFEDTDLWHPARVDAQAMRERFGLAGKRILMFPGTVRPHKGLEDLLHVMDSMQRDDLRLVLVGGRETGQAEAEALAQKWPRWVVRLPRFGSVEMPSVVALADVVVVPQRDTAVARAQFPIKLTDAMAMAKPVVTTRVGDIPDVIGDAGWVVAPGDPAALAAALKEALDDPDEATRRGQRARERCVSGFSVDSAATRLRALLGLD
jgi:glycosyltransferase involved in cell wall biosynthesis